MDEETHHPIQQPAQQSARSDETTVVCALCGASADSGSTPPTWICSVENGRRQYFCDQCARTHIRAIESRLDSSWW
ncbi:hypothetical protein ACFV1C_29970 [Streptomyces sp. NPDC059605]|uniref:hypothetical protein n=1 Tax=unclassified Streptomyces TaxID=2593676 RepID=UPI0033BE0BD5